jgi:hypothetical protein
MVGEYERVELEGGHTFRIRLFDDMFRKLVRESQRFEKSEGRRQDSIDHAINFCMTAWHMTDWVWARYSEYLCCNLMGPKRADFQLCIRQQNPAMGVCDVIANAVKHGGIAYPMLARPSVQTLLVADPRPPGMDILEFVTTNGERPIELRVVVDGRQQNVYLILSQAKSFWWHFKQAHLKPDNANGTFIVPDKV